MIKTSKGVQLRYLMILIALAIPRSGFGAAAVGQCEQTYWANGANQYVEHAQCESTCKHLVFDCDKRKAFIDGKPIGYLGCNNPNAAGGSKTGIPLPKKRYKINGKKCGSGGTGGGGKALLGPRQPAISSDPLPCPLCTIHLVRKGTYTRGCVGLEADAFRTVSKNCGGCNFDIHPWKHGSNRSSAGESVNTSNQSGASQ